MPPSAAKRANEQIVAADVALRRGDHREAAELYGRVASSDPSHGYARYRLGEVMLALHDARAAEDALREAAQIGHPAARFELAILMARDGRTHEAIESIQSAIDAGFRDHDRLATDPSLVELRETPEYAGMAGTFDQLMRPALHQSEKRELDFWLGDWEVRSADGRLAGWNRIASVLNGAAVAEAWTSIAGWHGQSINFHSAHHGTWEQLWLDDGGEQLHFLRGERQGPAMHFPIDATGLHRLTLTSLPGARVRQLAEALEGGSWSVEYELFYLPRQIDRPGKTSERLPR